ncbi:hypothetical protein [Nocardioides mesophilus]|uniref:Uncharacterized protein n=1 Tax=Nocardioides mesophilus TaxID=433659 RepID=A0A7G9RD88_9ACTN|nr:hypothetical protein [Nocardioides mesophilus]QNN53563.1 hypothetical protein H9L09_03810 [Nocardioides mesophilus]
MSQHDVIVPGMEWFKVLVPVVLGLIGGNLASLRRAGRLRRAVLSDVEILNGLPDGSAKLALQKVVEHRVHLLIAEETPSPEEENLKRRRGWSWVAVGIVLFLATPIMIAMVEGPEGVSSFGLLAGASSASWGFSELVDTGSARRKRRREGRVAAYASTSGGASGAATRDTA